MHRATEYMKGVQSGKTTVNNYARLAVERQLKDLKRQKTKTFPYEFRTAEAQHVLDVFDTFRYTKGKWRGQPWRIMPWQAFIVSTIYGWYNTETGKRRYRDVYIKVPRKNAKTELMIGLAQYGFIFEGEIDPEIYWFATKKEQAKIGWSRQKVMTEAMITEHEEIADYCSTSTYRIFTNEGLGWSAYLSRDSKSEDGPAPFYGIADEYHAFEKDGMVEAVVSGMGTRDNPLLLRITTAGTNPDGPCKRHEEFCENVLDGVVDAESVFCIMYGMDKGDDPNDREVWRKVNPAYDYIDTLPDFIQSHYDLAKKKGGTTWINFLTKNLNQWSDVIEHWIDLDVWTKHATDYDYSDLIGRTCFGGLDLASVRDTNCLCLFFPPEAPKERSKFLWFFWVPEKEAREQGEKYNVDYLKWVEEELVTLTPGNAVDYARIASDITGVHFRAMPDGNIERQVNEECPLVWFNIDHINYDRKFSPDAIPRLTAQGLDMRPIGQGFYSLSAPTKMFESMIVNGEIDPGKNAMADWQFSNIVIEQDAAENIKITKNPRYQQRKVDGMQAAVIALAGWMDHEAGRHAGSAVTIDSF